MVLTLFLIKPSFSVLVFAYLFQVVVSQLLEEWLVWLHFIYIFSQKGKGIFKFHFFSLNQIGHDESWSSASALDWVNQDRPRLQSFVDEPVGDSEEFLSVFTHLIQNIDI